MPKLITGQKPYTYLVANLRQGSDPSKGPAGNPQKMRSKITRQHFPEVSKAGDPSDDEFFDPSTPGIHTRLGLVEGESTPATATVTVADNDFSAGAILYVGVYTLVAGVDFSVGGSVGATAANLANAINNLDGFSASPSGADVDITGAGGPTGNETRLEADYGGGVTNYTITRFAGGLPEIGPPDLA